MPFHPPSPIASPHLYAPLTLALVGDGVYDLYVRTRLAQDGSLPAAKLHRAACGIVNAAAQADSFRAIEGLLTEAEVAIFKRGRNAKAPTVPKNADVTDYRTATGFEALLGWLYLSGAAERLDVLMGKAFEAMRNAQGTRDN